jgi:hypothetical protein
MKLFWTIAVLALLLLGFGWWQGASPQGDAEIISREGIHWHPQLEIYVRGEKVEIPEGIGLIGAHSPMHTHDDLPLIHMEFSGVVRKDDTRLGNFFTLWGKSFNATQLFDYRNGSEGTVRMFVNGQESSEFEQYHMRDGDRIEIRYE